jgi:hypothetical protein
MRAQKQSVLSQAAEHAMTHCRQQLGAAEQDSKTLTATGRQRPLTNAAGRVIGIVLGRALNCIGIIAVTAAAGAPCGVVAPACRRGHVSAERDAVAISAVICHTRVDVCRPTAEAHSKFKLHSCLGASVPVLDSSSKLGFPQFKRG